MAVLYSKERSKYGNLTGQIINWPVDYNGLPDDGANVNNLGRKVQRQKTRLNLTIQNT